MASNINALRYCADIDLWALDRGLKSCVFATDFCRQHCYNKKLYKVYPAMLGRDEQNDAYWNSTYSWDIAQDIGKAMAHKKGASNRFRFCTRGEALGTISDIIRVIILADTLPDVLFWVPTRSWRSVGKRTNSLGQHNDMYALLMKAKLLPNLRIMASIDPTTTTQELTTLKTHGWSTISFGVPVEERHFLCPKTHDGIKGACSTCQEGCFSSGQVNVHLKEH